MTDFEFAYAFTKPHEGGWSNVKDDPGGATNYGITLSSFQDFARRDPKFIASLGFPTRVTVDHLRNMTPQQAERIFERFYWDCYHLDEFMRKTSAFLFDCTVNHGYRNAVKIAQRGYNDCRPQTAAKLVEDGVVGARTQAAFAQAADSDSFIRACISRREAFYRSIVAGKPSQQKFLQGWMNRCKDQGKYLCG